MQWRCWKEATDIVITSKLPTWFTDAWIFLYLKLSSIKYSFTCCQKLYKTEESEHRHFNCDDGTLFEKYVRFYIIKFIGEIIVSACHYNYLHIWVKYKKDCSGITIKISSINQNFMLDQPILKDFPKFLFCRELIKIPNYA